MASKEIQFQSRKKECQGQILDWVNGAMWNIFLGDVLEK